MVSLVNIREHVMLSQPFTITGHSHWHYWLNRRTRGSRLTWDHYNALLRRHPLLLPRIRNQGSSSELRLKNPLREICTAGSAREETFVGAMVDLNGHEAGNGGHIQVKPTALGHSSTRRDGDIVTVDVAGVWENRI